MIVTTVKIPYIYCHLVKIKTNDISADTSERGQMTYPIASLFIILISQWSLLFGRDCIESILSQ